MIPLFVISFKAIFAILIVGAFSSMVGLVLLFIIFTTRKPPKRNQTLTDAIQEGINEVDVDFEVKHPRAMFECPYSDESCEHMNTLTMKPSVECRDCERTINV